MTEIEYDVTTKRHRHVIDVPRGVSITDTFDIYNQGWGHSMSAAINFFINEINLFEVDEQLKDAFIRYMEERRSKNRNVHFKKDRE